MFVDKDLQNHLETADVIKSNSIILAEWNMNSLDNIKSMGNYRYRPLDDSSSKYQSVTNTFDINDDGKFYTDATYSDITIDGGLDNQDVPVTFTSRIEKERSLFSLEDCFGKFRPRSGINKLRYFENKFSHHNNINMARRPRYYMADRKDLFKYWTSYRVENNIERGIAKNKKNDQFFIDDAAPFVVYKNAIPANRIVIKMQTNVGDIDLGPFSNSFGSVSDPFYGTENQTTPIKWKIQVLRDNGWIDAKSFNPASIRNDGTSIVGPDGYVELIFGLIIPEEYSKIFKNAGEYSSISFLPRVAKDGEAFLVKSSDDAIGVYHIWVSGQYKTFSPSYGWSLYEESTSLSVGAITDFINPGKYTDPGTGADMYREIEYISGIRVVVETMNKIDSTFDLIEMSPRLVADISDMSLEYGLTKQASDLGISGMPVGQLLASTGSLSLFDEHGGFNENNKDSVVSNHLSQKIQFKFYEAILDVDGKANYYVPIKTLYSDIVPTLDYNSRIVDVVLRDMFFYFESITAPQIFIQNVSVSYAVSLLLDNIGFSNYVFKRVPGETEMIIPSFFIGPDRSVAEVLQDIAVSTQTAMFFDEYNNFVMMSKEYMLPTEEDRQSDITLYGNDLVIDKLDNSYVFIDHVTEIQDLPQEKQSGAYTVGAEQNIYTWSDQTNSWLLSGEYKDLKIASNIVELSSQENKVYNDGKINYTTRYIQKVYALTDDANAKIDNEKFWRYSPALLWEATGGTNTKSINGSAGNQQAYTLSAIPLNTKLSANVPQVVSNTIINNTIDFGEAVYLIARYNGYFYSNGEIIKYDAVQYNIPKTTIGDTGNSLIDNNVWISTVEEYEYYFSKLSFNGKIYPTGLVRIYSEPNYETVDGISRLKNGAVAKHGRGQFGTSIVEHESGLSSYWSNPLNRRACTMKSSHLFSDEDIPATTTGIAGSSPDIASKTECNGIIKNYLSNSYISESPVSSLKSTQLGTVQSSALILNGPSFTTTEKSVDSVSYVYKTLDSHYRHFGTRMRIIGKIENSETRGQTPIGSTTYFSTTENSTTSGVTINGASGGLAVMLNPETNNGYYFEIAALTEGNVENYSGENNIYNIFFYKVKQKSGTTEAIPIRLWAGLTQILVDNGKFTGQSRIMGEKLTTVYDLAVEYETIGTSRKFYLYLNNSLVTTVEDTDPLPIYNSMALFVRGSARCMFENIYSLTNNYGKDSSYVLDTPLNSVFGDDEISVNESFRKYSMSGMIQSTYLSGLSSAQEPKYNIYFEEFGTIMREASYFNVRYDKAYPALNAQLSPTFNSLKGYTVSGFVAGPYGAEFLIFNNTDTLLELDASTGNYLKIQGATFTQQSANEFSVDQYFTKNSDRSDPEMIGSSLVRSPLVSEQNYNDIKYSRSIYGRNEFSINSTYLQSQDDANSMMSWMVSKIMKPRKAIGVTIFAMPTLQLGDIVNLQYSRKDGYGEVSRAGSRFVIYSIDYERSQEGPAMTVYLSEVV